MLTYDFENVDIPLYEHIYRCIKNDIIAGNLKQGERLPSKRSFAENNGISTITIQNAYDQLMSEGYIYAVQRKGYYVSKFSDFSGGSFENEFSRDIKIPSDDEKIEIDLSGNSMNPKNFPFSIWARLMRATIAEKNSELMIPSPTGGIRELREAISSHLKSFRGMSVDPNQIVVGAGTEYLYTLIIQLLGNDKIYCLEDPGYKKIAQVYMQNNVEIRFSEMDENGITVEGLESSGAHIAHISSTHHFPTGVTMPISRRYEVLGWANKAKGRYIIEDDYDSEFRPSGKPIPPIQSIDAAEKVIYMNTFSKSLASTIRISYMVMPVHIANLFYDKLSFYSCTVSNFEQYTLAEFIKKNYFEKHINRMRRYYAGQRRKVLDCIYGSKLNKLCEIIENDSGLHFLMKLDTKLSDADFIKFLRKKGIVINALSGYFSSHKNKSEHIFLLNYSNVDISKLSKALDILYEAAVCRYV
ncbi:MAG: MocR-like pyridoxine biosynthesis transcription factor PdxR [Anaerovoracaceae bacterium]